MNVVLVSPERMATAERDYLSCVKRCDRRIDVLVIPPKRWLFENDKWVRHVRKCEWAQTDRP